MAPSPATPQLAWHAPPAATRDYLGYLLASQRPLVVPHMEQTLRQTPVAAATLVATAPAEEWLSRLTRQVPPPNQAGNASGPATGAQASESAGEPKRGESTWAEAALDACLPGWQDHLTARTRPLRELWQARGPGFLRQLLRQLPPPTPASTADSGDESPAWPILAVYPLSGGYGLLMPDRRTLLLEAMVTDADDRLPEIVRLAWLVTQRALAESPAAASLPPANRPVGEPLAACLLTLLLAHDLEWMPVGPPLFGIALQAWDLAPHAARPQLEERFRLWWQDGDTRPDWASVCRFFPSDAP